MADGTNFFCGGWGCGKREEYRDFADYLSKLTGRPTYVVQFIRRPEPGWDTNLVTLPNRMQRFKAWQVIEEIKRTEGDVHLIGYSEGAIHAILAAANSDIRPRVRSITLLNPAGLPGVESPVEIIARAARNMWHHIKAAHFGDPAFKQRLQAHVLSILAYKRETGGNLFEAMQAGRVDLTELLKQLSRSIWVRVVLADKDAMISKKKILAKFHGPLVELVVEEGTHFEIFKSPQKFARLTAENARKHV